MPRCAGVACRQLGFDEPFMAMVMPGAIDQVESPMLFSASLSMGQLMGEVRRLVGHLRGRHDL